MGFNNKYICINTFSNMILRNASGWNYFPLWKDHKSSKRSKHTNSSEISYLNEIAWCQILNHFCCVCSSASHLMRQGRDGNRETAGGPGGLVFKPLSHAVHCRIKGLLDEKTALFMIGFFFLWLLVGWESKNNLSHLWTPLPPRPSFTSPQWTTWNLQWRPEA